MQLPKLTTINVRDSAENDVRRTTNNVCDEAMWFCFSFEFCIKIDRTDVRVILL